MQGSQLSSSAAVIGEWTGNTRNIYRLEQSFWAFLIINWEILPILPSWRLSGVGILANKALGPSGPRALLASIPTPLNLQLGNIDTVCPSYLQQVYWQMSCPGRLEKLYSTQSSFPSFLHIHVSLSLKPPSGQLAGFLSRQT